LIDENRPWWERVGFKAIRYVRGLFLASLIVWAVTMPLIMARFHVVSWLAALLAVVLLPFMTVALVSGFVLLTLGWLIPPLGALAGWICNGSLAVINIVIDGAQKAPRGHFWVAGPEDWWLWVFYTGLAAVVAGRLWKPHWRWCTGLLVGWIAVGLAVWGFSGRSDRLECTFLSVGHGLATVLELPDGHVVLYDAGSFASPDGAALSVASCLWEHGHHHLDAVVISHADADHYNAFPSLIRRVSVGVVYAPPSMLMARSRALVALRDAIEEEGVPLRPLTIGERLVAGDGQELHSIRVLHPPPQGAPASDNAGSVVLLVEALGRRVLLPGDLEPPGLDMLLASPPVDSDVLLVPHHGSKRSSPPGLISWCRPEFAVISGSLRRDPTEIETVYLRAGSRVFHTGRSGAVRVVIEPDRLAVDPFLGEIPGG
jgi:competence protein ComEC